VYLSEGFNHVFGTLTQCAVHVQHKVDFSCVLLLLLLLLLLQSVKGMSIQALLRSAGLVGGEGRR
jgi:hypothetical protein